MGFGTVQQIGNRSPLADLFSNNIGSPRPLGITQNPNQLVTMLQSILRPKPQEAAQGQPQMGGQAPAQTPLSAITARPAGQGAMDIIRQGGLTNPFNKMVNQRFIR